MAGAAGGGVVAAQLAVFLARADADPDGGGLPRFVQREFAQ